MVSRALVLLALVALGSALRGARLGWPPLVADEAESSINALTILARGLPYDSYQGQPVYENTLVRPWPGSEEYAYRDLSYSDRGLAVYHGWLPLYAIAGAFAFAGVSPAQARAGPPARDGSTAELVRWTAVPRAAALVFSALLVALAWALGRATGGEGAGWAMALVTSVAGPFVYAGRQARYYAPTLALSAGCALFVWRAARDGRPRDYALAGLWLALVFHTHALAALGLAVVLAACLPIARSARRHAIGLGVTAAVALPLVLPWAAWAGVLEAAGRAPAGWRLLDRAAVAGLLPAALPAAAAASVLALSALARRGRFPPRPRAALLALAPAVYFAGAWSVAATAAFVFLAPAASFLPLRLKLAGALPAVLLGCLGISAVCSALPRRLATWGPAALLAAALVATGQARLDVPPPRPDAGVHRLARALRELRLAPRERVYAAPNEHLPLAYYSGLPVQSASAVRPGFLEKLPGFLVLEPARYDALPAAQVLALALAHGRDASGAAARELAAEASRLATVQDLARLGLRVEPAPRALDALETALVSATRERTRRLLREAIAGTPLAARASAAGNWSELWQAYFLWFAGEGAAGEPPWLPRARRGRSRVLHDGWVVHDCRPAVRPPFPDGE